MTVTIAFYVADIDECLTGSHNCDLPYAYCTNTVGSFECTCVEGYLGDGTSCSKLN